MPRYIKKLSLLACFSLVCAGSSLFSQAPPAAYVVDPTSTLHKPNRIGINLGNWTTYGTQQYSSNILMNPGFEGDIDRVFVFVNTTTWNTFFDQTGWGYDDGYWDGASYRVMSGESTGITGTVISSLYADPGNGLPAYVTDSALPPLSSLDAIVLSKATNTNPVPIWWIPYPAMVNADPTEARPGSPGIQSIKLTLDEMVPAELDFYLDAESDHADKFLIVSGTWKFSIWAKSNAENPVLQVLFRRINASPAFLFTTFNLTPEWKEYTITFNPEDEGYAQTVQLQLLATGSDGDVWLDDAFLGPQQSNTTYPFRKEVVSLLKELKPSYIRDTQGQLGDSFENRIAPLFGQRTPSSRFYAAPRSLSSLYSIGDLLSLCKTVGADPWIVVPPVFTPEEAYNLGVYLSKNASTKCFSKVIVEFGNENWNYQFRSTGIPYANVHGVVAEESFKNIQAGAGWGVNLVKVVNGQYVNPSNTFDYLLSSPSADAVAVAPYFFPELNTGTSELDNLTAMFATDTYMEDTVALAASINKRVSVYETNLTTQDGNAPASERDGYTVGAAAGASLARQLLRNMALKVEPQCLYSFNQYDIYSFSAGDFVKLWGISRDLSPTLRLRPQGLAMKMLNSVIAGDLYQVYPDLGESVDNLTIMAFREKKLWNLAAVNPNPDPVKVRVTFVNDGRGLPLELLTLKYASSPLDTNEDDENVTISTSTIVVDDNRTATFTIPAWGFVIGKGTEPLPLETTCCKTVEQQAIDPLLKIKD